MDGLSGSTSGPAGGAPAEAGMRNEERGDRRVGFHSLTPELLLDVVKVLAPFARYDEEDGAQEDPLLPLRCVSRGLRNAVDKAKMAHSFEFTSTNMRNGPMLLRALQGMQRTLPRWPHLVHMRLVFNWPSDHLHVALATIAASSPGLTNLYLEARPQDMERELDGPTGSVLAPLAALRKLCHLHLGGFSVFSYWWEGLSSLSSLTKLHLHDQGELILESLPALQDFKIDVTCPSPPLGTTALVSISPVGPRAHLMRLTESPSLGHLYLADVSIETLPVFSGHSTLEMLQLENVRIYGSCESFANLLHGPAPLPRLTTLLLADMRRGVPENLSLAACTGLTSLTLRYLPGVLSVQGLSSLLALRILVLENLRQLQELPPLGPAWFPSLQKMEIQYLDLVSQLPGFSAFPNLRELTLTHLKLVVDVPGLETLTRLKTLVIEACPNIDVPPASLASLGKLKSLCFKGAEAVEGRMSTFTLPPPNSLRELEALELGHWMFVRGLEGICAYTKLSSLTLSSIDGLCLMPSTLSQLHSLSKLSVSACPRLRVVELWGLQSLASSTLDGNLEWPLPVLDDLGVLQNLVIKQFAKPVVLGGLRGNTTLKFVTVGECPNLLEVNFLGSTALCSLTIENCPMLEEIKVESLVDIDFRDCPSLCRIRHR